MVKGLDKFREYFKGYEDNYVVIGGTACEIILSAAALNPRATKDIDVILVVEVLSKEFVQRFWEFIEAGQYGSKEKSPEERKHYRFKDPAVQGFPIQVELFSRVPDLIDINKDAHLTPIPSGEDLSSLSAILMNDDYYRLTVNLSDVEDGLKRASTEALICLKAKAFLEMSIRRSKGEIVSEKEIKKHKHDVFRMALTLTNDSRVELPQRILQDMIDFVEAVRQDLPGEDIFKELGAANTNPSELADQIEKTFGLAAGATSLDRRIARLKNSLDKKDVATRKLDLETASSLIRDTIIPLLRELESNCEKLQDLFNDHDRQITLRIAGGVEQAGKKDTAWPLVETAILTILQNRRANLLLSGLDYNFQLRGFKKNLTFNYMTTWLQFQFNEFSYSIRLNQDYQTARNYSYDAPLDKAEIDVIVGILMDKLLEQISEAGGLKKS